MDYEDLIEDENDPVSPEPEMELEAEPSVERPKSPWKAFVLTGLLASLVGAAGGGYGVYEGMKRITPEPVKAPSVDLGPMEKQIQQLTNRVKAAESQAQKAVNRPVETTSPVDLSGLESRLDALEAAPRPEIDPEALTALQSAQADGFEWPDTAKLESRLAELESQPEKPVDAAVPTELIDRLETLEADLTELQNTETEPAIDVEKVDRIEARLFALENRPAPAPEIKVETVSILAFPKKAMIAAAEDNIDGGFVKKALSKHVRVKDEGDPLTLIDGIEADIAKGRLAAAAEKYDRLPEPVRAAGHAWYKSVKASL